MPYLWARNDRRMHRKVENMRETLKIVKKYSTDILPAWRQKKIADEIDDYLKCAIIQADQDSYYTRCRQDSR